MFDERWLLALGAVGVWALWTGHSLAFLGAAMAMLVSASLALWRRWCLTGLSYSRALTEDRALYGEEVELAIEVRNLKLLPLTWLAIQDKLPRGLEVVGGAVRQDLPHTPPFLVMVLALLPYERVRRRIRIRCTRRGDHLFGPVQLDSGDYLGLLTRHAQLPGTARLLVLPRILPLAFGRIASRQIIGRDPVRHLLVADPLRIIGARDYAPGDPYRSIDWRASARVGSLMVRLIEPSTVPIITLLLDFAVPASASNRVDPDEIEFAISIAASLANAAVARRWAIGLHANGLSGGSPISLPRSGAPTRLAEIMEVLARADGRSNLPVTDHLARVGGRSVAAHSLVVITADLTPALLAGLLALRRRGAAVTVIQIVGEGTSPIAATGLAIWHAIYHSDWATRDALVIGD